VEQDIQLPFWVVRIGEGESGVGPDIHGPKSVDNAGRKQTAEDNSIRIWAGRTMHRGWQGPHRKEGKGCHHHFGGTGGASVLLLLMLTWGHGDGGGDRVAVLLSLVWRHSHGSGGGGGDLPSLSSL
jgi:hypothetical protein